MGTTDYFFGVDMWSVGCIFAELMLLRPLFGFNTDSQVIDSIFNLLGTPNSSYNSQYLSY